MNDKNKIYHYRLYCTTIVAVFLFRPLPLYAHTGGSLGGFGFIIFSFFFIFSAFLSSLFKRILYVPAKERGIIKDLSTYIMIGESACIISLFIIAAILESILDFSSGESILIIFAVIYFILAILINSFLFKKENQKYFDTIKSVPNFLNATLISLFSPGIFIVIIILVST